jgi:hypothetical protein
MKRLALLLLVTVSLAACVYDKVPRTADGQRLTPPPGRTIFDPWP